MKCNKIRKQLTAYLDNTLSPAEKGIICNHLKSCLKCRKSLADLEMTVRSIKDLEEIIPPPWLTQKIMTRVRTESELTKKRLWRRLFYPLHIKLPIEAVGVFLIALTALYVFRSMEPKMKTVIAPTEETVSEYTAKEKNSTTGTEIRKPFQAPAATRTRKDETAANAPSLQQSGPLPAPPSEQPMHGKEPSLKEERTEGRKVLEKDMLLKSAPSPAELSAPNELKQERAPQAAGKIMPGFLEKEDINISFKSSDIDSAKRKLEEVLSDLDGKVVREGPISDTLIIIGEVGSDKLLPFMQKLKMLGYVKERTPTPISGKDRVLIKITVSTP